LKSPIIENINKFDSVFLAAVHDSPYETAFSDMFNTAVKIENFHHKTFSVIDNALDWLLSNK